MGRPQIYCSDSPNPAAAERQSQVDADVAAFLAAGGRITQCPSCEIAEKKPKQKRTMSKRQMMKDAMNE